MGVSAPVAAKTSGLSTVIDTIASPSEAFERQRTMPTWGWALLAAVVLMLIGTYLQGPAMRHASVAQIQHMLANNPTLANVSDAKRQQMIANAGKPSPWAYAGVVLSLFVAVFFNTLVMLIGNAAGRGDADFKRLWCGSMNMAVPTLGLGAIALGAITMVRGADSFPNAFAVAQSVPSLGMLAPGANIVMATFLSGFSIFMLWGFFLNATMLRITAKTSPAIAYTFAAIVIVLGAAVAAAGAALTHKIGMV